MDENKKILKALIVDNMNRPPKKMTTTAPYAQCITVFIGCTSQDPQKQKMDEAAMSRRWEPMMKLTREREGR